MPKSSSIGIGEIKKAVKVAGRILSETPRKISQNSAAVLENQQTLAENHSYQQSETLEGQLSVDVYQTSTKILIIAPIAGVKKDDIDLSITEDVISIRGKRTPGLKTDAENYLTQECFWGNFSRSIILPENIDTTKVKATFKDAILKIEIPKTENLRTKVIKIRTE